MAGRSGSGVGLVVEDVHWADGETLDFLIFLVRGGRRAPVRVVVTCCGDEAPLAALVAGWLARVRGDAGTEEIRLGPLSRAQVAGLAAALAGGPVSPQVIDYLYARAEGNAFFTEQLVAACAGRPGGGRARVPAGLPARLAELLAARAGRCAGEARAVLAGLAVASRSLGEDVLAAVTGLEAGTVRRGLRELAAARLLAEDTSGRGHRPRHALLGEAVAAGLLPGERAVLHERTARALAAQRTERWPRRWPGTGRPRAARPRSSRPGWRRPKPPSGCSATLRPRRTGSGPSSWAWRSPMPPAAAGIDSPRLSVRAIDVFFRAGDIVRAGLVAEEAYRQFAAPPGPRHRSGRPPPRRVLPGERRAG